ncbi:hypothetical protein DFQ28_010573 [Apophysomyces sp. BC1034]|nr:hypothetical protein DFQ30_011463 [Apophysomyces sp. BC1015]KAG0183509.1 hypothetical protein DFQ29_002563 [Apophysomyces sp. BC1021]KAG0194489.1 hypothetical protein DFQ28_010573 [Apophysomyces sp. BC1034]
MLTRLQRKQLNKETVTGTSEPVEKSQESNRKRNSTKKRRGEPVIIIVQERKTTARESTPEEEDEQSVVNEENDAENQSEQEDDSSDNENEDLDEQEDNSDSDSEDEDLDQLLKNAESALRVQQIAQKKNQEDERFSKMESGISLEDQLYIKTHNKKAQLIQGSVALTDDNNATNKKALVTLKTAIDGEKAPSRKERQQEREKSTGKGWFEMPRTEITPEIRRDLDILKMRHVLDRKRHYKKTGKSADPKYFQVGTIIEGPTEFFSSRMSKRERKETIMDELLADDESKNYYKRKFKETQERTNSGNRKHYKKIKQKRQWTK